MKDKINNICAKANNLIDYCKSKNLFFIVLFFIIVLASFDVIYLDIVSVLLLLLITLFLKPEDMLYSYIFLFFFEPVTEVSILGGSINRVVLGLGIAKILYYSYKDKIPIKKESIISAIFFSSFLGLSFIIGNDNILENIILYVNIMFFIMYANYLSSCKISNKKKIIDKLLHTIVCSVFFSIVHGLLFWNFDLEQRMGFTNWRFNGTNDPNFLSYYINLAIIIQMFKNKSKKKWDKIANIVINVFLVIGLILTKSITGIFINVVSFIVFLYIKHKDVIKKYVSERKRKVIITCSIIFIVIGLGAFILIKKNIDEVYEDDYGNIVAKNRIADLLLSIKKGDVDRLTSQKTRDWRLFLEDYRDSNILNKAFGKGMNPYLIYSDHNKKEVASHSTYIDFLCCYGLIGMIMIMWYIIKKLRGNIVLYSSINNKIFRYIRIILLIYAIELNVYTNRVFLLMFLL